MSSSYNWANVYAIKYRGKILFRRGSIYSTKTEAISRKTKMGNYTYIITTDCYEFLRKIKLMGDI